MYRQSFNEATVTELNAVRSLIREALLAAVDASLQTSDSISTVGTLLFARDVSLPNESLPGEYAQMLQSLDSVNFDQLRAFKVNVPKKIDAPVVARRGSATVPVAARTRTEMLAGVLAAVATIETDRGSGSGFFVSGSGDLVTNAHVIEGATRIRVRTASKDVFLATMVRTDGVLDIALLRVAGYDGAFLKLATSDDAVVGADVIAVGSPLGLEGTVTRGIISARRTLGGVPVIQIDAAINPGNSGGPLLTEDGVVVGVNSWKIRPGRAESLGFAVTASAVRKVLGALLP
jgi:S1-C subfamily serine protease